MVEALDALGPDRAIGPAVNAEDIAEHAGLVPLFEEAGALGGVALIAHLSGDFLLAGAGGEEARLGDGVRHGLLDEDVFTQRHRRHRDGEMHVIGRRDGDGVDLRAQLVEELAVIAEARDRRVGLERVGRAGVVDIGKGDEIFLLHRGDGCAAAAADADAGDVEFAVGRHAALAAHNVGKRDDGGRDRRGFQEGATGEGQGGHGNGNFALRQTGHG